MGDGLRGGLRGIAGMQDNIAIYDGAARFDNRGPGDEIGFRGGAQE